MAKVRIRKSMRDMTAGMKRVYVAARARGVSDFRSRRTQREKKVGMYNVQ